MGADEFITALIRHIPPPQLRMIRYYGAYARRTKKSFKKYLQSSIEQAKLMKYGVELPERILKCHFCDGKLEFVMYIKKGPLALRKEQRELLDYISGESKI